MSGARDLFKRYLEQRQAVDEGPLVLGEGTTAFPPYRLTARPPIRRSAEQPITARPPVRPPAGWGAGSGERSAEQPITARPPVRPSAGGGREGRWKRGAPPVPPRGIVVPPPATDLFTADDWAQVDLEQLAGLVRVCARCGLCQNRTNAVPGEGPTTARLVVVGEGPGAREDETGRPFVGRAGGLLTDILEAIELPRSEVFICNIIKCRAPDNRKPRQDEIDACVPYLYRQLEIIGPKVILAMGGTAAETLLNTKQSLGSLRNRIHSFRGVPLVVTYHPAALLRNPNWKKPTWDDVRIARQLLDG